MGGGFCQWLGPEHGYWWCLLSPWPSGPASCVGSRAQGDLATARVDSELLGVCRPGQPWQSWLHWASTAVVHRFDCLHPSCQAVGPPLVCLHSILWFTARLLPSLFHVCPSSLTDTYRKPRLTSLFPELPYYLSAALFLQVLLSFQVYFPVLCPLGQYILGPLNLQAYTLFTICFLLCSHAHRSGPRKKSPDSVSHWALLSWKAMSCS